MKISRLILAVGLGLFILSSSAFAASPFPADVKMNLNFKDAEITTLIENFAKSSQKTFVVDPGVRGRISVFAAGPVDLDEAFDLISTSLALNGYAILEREGRYVVMAARNAGRSSIPTLTEITSLKPERYVTFIYSLKHISANEVNRQLRILPSKDGEFTPMPDTNQVIITDYLSNVNRIVGMLKVLDVPVGANVAKVIKDGKTREAREAKNEFRPKMMHDPKSPSKVKGPQQGPLGEGP